MSTTIVTSGVKYIGSKASLVKIIVDFIEEHLPGHPDLHIIDVFTGTTRVAQAFRSKGWRTTTSDLSWAAEAYAHAFVIRTATSTTRIPELLQELSELPGTPDWITNTYCDVHGTENSIVRVWKPENGAKADAIRNQIAEWASTDHITEHEAMILIACLLFALDKVDSTVGVQQAYLKQWAARASNPLTLLDLPFGAGPPGQHLVGDCLTLTYPDADVAYLDPPYSAHSYATYYHIWDSITRWDKPVVGLKTNRRMDRVSGSEGYDTTMQSAWNSKKTVLRAFLELIARLPVRFVVISYNDESLVPLSELQETLEEVYQVEKKMIPYTRNIMSQIGNAAVGVAAEGNVKSQNNEVLLWIAK
jgi:adenine-specific DNA-methyltransferase